LPGETAVEVPEADADHDRARDAYEPGPCGPGKQRARGLARPLVLRAAATLADQELHGRVRERRVDQAAADRAGALRPLLRVLARCRPRLDEPPDRVRREPDREQDQHHDAEALAGQRVQRALTATIAKETPFATRPARASHAYQPLPLRPRCRASSAGCRSRCSTVVIQEATEKWAPELLRNDRTRRFPAG